MDCSLVRRLSLGTRGKSAARVLSGRPQGRRAGIATAGRVVHDEFAELGDGPAHATVPAFGRGFAGAELLPSIATRERTAERKPRRGAILYRNQAIAFGYPSVHVGKSGRRAQDLGHFRHGVTPRRRLPCRFKSAGRRKAIPPARSTRRGSVPCSQWSKPLAGLAETLAT